MEKEVEHKELLIKGKKRALRLLERKDYSRKELWNRLLKDGYEEAVTEEIISYIDGYHYLDDIRVAGNYIRGKKEYKSKRELEFLLKQKGINNEDGIAQEELAIARQLQKYHASEEQLVDMSYEEKQKIAAKLYRKGFDSEKIRKMLRM